MVSTHPDAYVQMGVIRDMQTHVELPSYTGLCLANLAGRTAIMLTTLDTDGTRDWEMVHWGPVLSTTLIAEFMRGREEQF